MAPETRQSSDIETLTIRFIPATELVGSRADKLVQLDELLVYLHDLRRALAGHADVDAAMPTHRARRHNDGRRWYYAGLAVVALLCLFAMLAWVVSGASAGR